MSRLILQDLRNAALIEPATKRKADTLYIISGYTSHNFANEHLREVSNLGVTINLISGMPEDIDEVKKDAYCDLQKTYEEQFHIHCVNEYPPVHSKMYAWFSGSTPIVGFAGSANYSSNGFPIKQIKQQNQLTEANPIEIKDYFAQLLEISIPIQERTVKKRTDNTPHDSTFGDIRPGGIKWLNDDRTKVSISLVRRSGHPPVPESSGLNWEIPNGSKRRPFRPDPKDRWKYDAAYLRVPKQVHKENPNFFPERDTLLTLKTDDGKIFYCTIQQDDRKAITTTGERERNPNLRGNRQLGLYLRKRIGVTHGDHHPKDGYKITLEDLEAYGRTDYTIEKISDESYFFDFSAS